MSEPNPSKNAHERPVSVWLGIGIFLVPLVFAWFTLRGGYSQTVRIVAFGWLAVLYSIVLIQDGFAPRLPATQTAVSQITAPAPIGPAPSGFGPLLWGAKPSAALRKVTDQVYEPRKRKLPPFLGIEPAEEDYEFDDHRLFGGSLYFDGAQTYAKLKTLLRKTYGLPQKVDDALSLWTWEWQKERVTAQLYYQASHKRATLHFEQGGLTDDELAALPQTRLDAALADARALKQRLRDPSSAQWAKVLTNFDGSVVCILLRARNGFGGMSVEGYTFYKNNSRSSQNLSDWRRYCESAPMFDYSDQVSYLMSWE